MPSFTISTASTTPQTLAGSEVGILLPGSSLVTPSTAISLTLPSIQDITRVFVGGTIISHSMSNGAIYGSADTLTADIGAQGSINTFLSNAISVTTNYTLYVTNHGIVKGWIDGLSASLAPAVHAVVNHGLMSGTVGKAMDIRFTGQLNIINTGVVTSAQAAAIKLLNFDQATAILRNSGDIVGGSISGSTVTSYSGCNATDIVLNSGTMIGDVLLNGGHDRYDGNGGVVNGVILGADGNDTITGGDAADNMDGGALDDTLVGRDGDDTMTGGTGADRMIGGSGNDLMDGSEDNDTLTGNSGDDTMTGGTGDDILVGQDGADSLDGGADNDILDGGSGDDILEGGAGNDILRGRAGEDELAGGLGRDFLTGGQDADSFVFRGINETVVGAMRDQILDFEQGLDLIVVAGISPGVFEFRGTAAFDPTGNPELRLIETASGSTIVQIDPDGNGEADAEIRVAGVTGLTADDFVL